ncbi:hypothetical protein [Gillisia sp. Hel_I_86]|uniref:hypothetical protein n=1 Tax=Gillisia sp. Hel_I_86 TaxID=1249981 RepID=UPI0021BDECBA|nr:hypothetical protein [Gillisia sp. Hel_I_86]
MLAITYKEEIFKAVFKATITHVEQGTTWSCLINASGEIMVSDTSLNSFIPSVDHAIGVQFAQLILKLE